MRERGQALANFSDTLMIEISHDDTRPFHFAVEDFSPWIDNHTVAVRHPPIFVLATLADRQ